MRASMANARERCIAVIDDSMIGMNVPRLGTVLRIDVGGCLVLDLLENGKVEAYIVGTKSSDRSSTPKVAS